MGLSHVFGDKPLMKVLDFFMLHQFWDYSIKDISKATGVSYRALQSMMPQLMKKGFLIYTRTEGRAKLYVFNRDSTVARQLKEFTLKMDVAFLKGGHKEKTEMPVLA